MITVKEIGVVAAIYCICKISRTVIALIDNM